MKYNDGSIGGNEGSSDDSDGMEGSSSGSDGTKGSSGDGMKGNGKGNHNN